MRHPHSFHISLLSFAALLAAVAPIPSMQALALDWKKSSLLSSGKWIKIETGKQGMMKIPYSRLKEMGFSSPEKVGVFGRGGAMLPLSFTDASGRQIYSDDIAKVGCMHHDGALYFYAQGTDTYDFTVGHGSPGHFAHQPKNIYSSTAVYFLSDACGPLTAERRPDTEAPDPVEAQCFGLVFHERDMEHNTFNNGQLFWGESLRDPAKPYKEKTRLPGLVAGATATLDCGAYIEMEDKYVRQGNLRFGISGVSEEYYSKVTFNSAADFQPVPGTRINIPVPSDTPEIFVEYDGYDDGHICANLDYWSISYPLDPVKALAEGLTQISFAALHPLEGQPSVTMPDASAMAWDVTDPSSPVMLNRTASGESCLLMDSHCDYSMIAVFNPGAMDSSTITWSEIPNQDIHALASEGADFAIITLPELKDQALRLASLHEEHYGQKCIVATTEQLYNEYSGGTPDIMAYRGFARMLYDSPTPLENVLLFGAIRADARAIRNSGEAPDHIIAFQSPYLTKRDGAMNVNDFIGTMCDFISDPMRLEVLPMEVGVGVLPLLSSVEARTYVDKAERYMTSQDLASAMASHLMVGCEGDSHQHESQCLKLQAQLEATRKGHLFNTIFNDHVGYDAAHRGIHAALNSGVGLASYIGHGGSYVLAKGEGMFHYTDIQHLRNLHTPFMYFSACNLTFSDMALRGMSEEMVVGTRHGLIGTMTSSRTAWSGPNFDLMKAFYSSLYQSDSQDPAPLPITVGKAYAKAKTITSTSNEQSFFLICDPALKIPVVLREMSDPGISAEAGRKITFSGHVLDANGEVDRDFNGRLSVRLLAPAVVEPVAGVMTGDPGIEDVTYRSQTLTLGTGDVTEGIYTGCLIIPPHTAADANVGCSILLAAYDPERHLSAASIHECAVTPGGGDDMKDDVTAPWVTAMEYDRRSGCLVVDTADDNALDVSTSYTARGFALSVDGNEVAASQCNNISILADISECRHTIPVGNLSKGTHAAAIRVRDAAGNIHEEERMFEVGDASAAILSADCRNTEGKISFCIEGGPDAGKVLIYDMEGKRILSVKAAAGHAETETRLLGSGRYRAVFESSDAGLRSNTVTLTII